MKLKRALLGASLALLMAVVPATTANADIGAAFTVFNGVTTDITSAEFNVSKASFIRVRAWSQSGSVATITVQARSGVSTSEPWYTIDSTSNVDSSTGWYEDIPVAMRMRFVISGYISGTIFLVLETHQISP